ncbi:MAG: hypothetical protein Q9170_005780 [Blastenia crenularia]
MVHNFDTATCIEDIRQNDIGSSVLDELHQGLRPEAGKEKRLPTLLLYDEKGLKLFEDISYLDEYYPTNAEIEVLQKYAIEIVASIPQDCVILELGAGNLRKVEILLDALESAKKEVQYYALDLSEPELERTLSAVPKHWEYVRCRGLLGTYDDALDWLQRPELKQRPKWILSIGSSIGNFGRQEAASFLQRFANTLQSTDVLFIGLDACQDPDKVYHAYNDTEGKTHEFILNGLLHANRLLRKNIFKLGDWKVIGEYDTAAGRHQAFYSPLKDLVIDGVYITAGERVRVEESYKYSSLQSDELWRNAGLAQRKCFGNRSNDYYMHILARSVLDFPLNPVRYGAQPVPSLDEFRQLWSAWDLVTQRMIPRDELLSKPIKLRHSCVFYLGHIPTFLDIHLTKATGQAPTEPSRYRTIFERGIDPDVDNPEHCHAHSQIPDEWPPIEEILDYQDRVRSRAKALLEQKGEPLSRRVERALWLAFEHEGMKCVCIAVRVFGAHVFEIEMHLETLLYMLLQSDRALPPPGLVPDFQALAQDAQQKAIPNEWIKVPSTTITVGMDDPENDSGPARYFGWDNEKPSRKVHVPAFEAKARPLTNEDYARYLHESGQPDIPASWSQTEKVQQGSKGAVEPSSNGRTGHLNGHGLPLEKAFLTGKFVKTLYGPVALEYALAWPVFASYDELAGCAKWMNGRIPTADETRSIYSYVDLAKKKETEKVLARTISAVNGHLSNGGVEETPPSALGLNGSSGVKGSPEAQQLFANLEGCNVGFSTFHPTPVTQFGNKLCGRGEMGGVWEWTSSTLEEHEGFTAMDSYPGYTAQRIDIQVLPLRGDGSGRISSEYVEQLQIDEEEEVAIGRRGCTAPSVSETPLFLAEVFIRVSFHLRSLTYTLPIVQLDNQRRSKIPTRTQYHKFTYNKPRDSSKAVPKRKRHNAPRTTLQMGKEQWPRCRKSVELHDKRHREIATFLLNIQKIDEAEQAVLSPITNRKRKTRKSEVFDVFHIPRASENTHEEGEWADSSTLNEDEGDTRSPQTNDLKENYTPRGLTKTERKRVRHSGLVQVITPELMNAIDATLHPEDRLSDDKENRLSDITNAALSHKIIVDNIAFNTHCFKPSSMRQSVHLKKIQKANGIGKSPSPKSAQEDPEITWILGQLGIRPAPPHSSKERSALVKQLRNAIRDDSDKVENENRDTMMRMAGYWRYVNRKTYNFMVRQNQIWDWATGQKLEEIEEEDESDFDTEDDRDTDGASWDDNSTLGTPLSGVGTPCNEIEDYAEDYDLDEMKGLRLVDEAAVLDAELNERFHDHIKEDEDTCVLTPKASHFIFDSPEPKTRIPAPKPLLTVPRNDTRHLRPTSISTLKTDEPFDFLLSTPSTLVNPASDKEIVSIPHHDPNNRYNPLAKLNGGLNQRLPRSKKSLRLSPATIVPSKETTGSWTTVKGRGPGASKISYAGALKRKI